jgi:hypothetical protein
MRAIIYVSLYFYPFSVMAEDAGGPEMGEQ